MKNLLRIIQCFLWMAVIAMTSCRGSMECDSLFFKRMHVVATYEQEWQIPPEGGTDWKNFSAWNETFHIPYDLLNPRKPEGLRVQFYLHEGESRVFNMNAEGGIVPSTNKEQSLLFYNNNTEYIVFDELHSLKMATATTRSRSQDKQQRDIMEEAMNAPDMLYAQYIEAFKGKDQAYVDTVSVSMRPLVFSYLIQFEFSKGLEHIAKARGALTGMADAVLLSEGRTSSKTATLLFDCTPRDFAVQALVRSFGTPDEISRPTNQHTLELKIMLKNGKTQDFQFDVTEILSRQPRGGVIRIQDIEVSDKALDSSHDSGFDVDVNDWGDFEKVPIPV